MLCTAEFDGIAMSTREVTALVVNVLLAAVEPADKTLALLFKHLIDHPGQLAQVRRDPAMLLAAVDDLARDPRGARAREALTAGYFSGAPTREAAARRPGLPYGTYRRHLRHGLDLLCEAPWQQELHGPAAGALVTDDTGGGAAAAARAGAGKLHPRLRVAHGRLRSVTTGWVGESPRSKERTCPTSPPRTRPAPRAGST
ncbi:hypothetical protein AB0442_08580 [Kitasatospora sp. NPDC085895]|uniref:hypothetical protein n=1 Tax=Kitasatospora sp. NPDC085895 TaxID=3155057 RepID=UPI00344B106E